MILTKEQQAILDGEKGETLAKVMKTLVMYGEAFGAEKMVPITSKNNHLVTSFGLKVMSPVYDLMQTLLDGGVTSEQKFSVDPRPIDPNVPANFLQKIVFNKFMYSKQDFYEGQLEKLGLMDDKAFTCTCYMDEVGNKPEKGEVLSWAESSAVVYANSVLGARCNRNSGIIELMCSIVGYVPYFGLVTDEGRKASWVVEIKTTKKPEAQLLGSAIGMKVVEDVPYVVGLDKWIGKELNDSACAYLKDFGAATASNGAVGLYHIENLTSEAVELGDELIAEGAKEYADEAVAAEAELREAGDSSLAGDIATLRSEYEATASRVDIFLDGEGVAQVVDTLSDIKAWMEGDGVNATELAESIAAEKKLREEADASLAADMDEKDASVLEAAKAEAKAQAAQAVADAKAAAAESLKNYYTIAEVDASIADAKAAAIKDASTYTDAQIAALKIGDYAKTTYVDEQVTAAKTFASTYTDELFNSVTFATDDDITALFS